MVLSEWDKLLSDDDIAGQHRLIDSIDFGLWQFNIHTEKIWWSAGAYKLLNYEAGEIPYRFDFFAERLLHPNDYHRLTSVLPKEFDGQFNFSLKVRLFTKNNKYCWYEISAKAWNSEGKRKLIGTITDCNEPIDEKEQLVDKNILLDETIKLAKLGGWEFNVLTKRLNWSKEVYEIYELPIHTRPTLRRANSHFEPEHRKLINKAIANAIHQGQGYDLEVPLLTTSYNRKWVRIKGIPIIGSDGKCIILRGIIQDINEIKSKDNELQTSLNLLSDQNKRLQNFAYIVAHNLRSHTGNLQFMVDLYHKKAQALTADCGEILHNIQAISNNLSCTIENLNEIVHIQTRSEKVKKDISLLAVFNSTVEVLEANINAAEAIVKADFDTCPYVHSIPAYIESVFLNMISNAVKYALPGRQPVIACRSYLKDQQIYLIFEDNGSGIDLNKYKNNLFGMYKTFHRNTDSKGLGLYITRNQVEELGGTIEVESSVGIGTKFVIKLNY